MLKTVGIFTANRAEKGLLDPVYKAIAEAGMRPVWCDAGEEKKDGSARTPFQWGAAFAEWIVLNGASTPDFFIVPCDREEMVGVALHLFYHNYPFAQFHGGDIGSGTHDEVGRWIISRCASIHFCNSIESAGNLIKTGEEEWRVHTVGSTAFDGIDPEFDKCPTGDFDLLLVHPDTYSLEDTHRDSLEALGMIDKQTVIIGPNHDRNNDVVRMNIDNFMGHWHDSTKPLHYYPAGVHRPQFLGLMQRCTRFITNSSSALLELPMFGIAKHVNIGKRNALRLHLKNISGGASQRIAEILKNLVIDDNLLRKKFTNP